MTALLPRGPCTSVIGIQCMVRIVNALPPCEWLPLAIVSREWCDAVRAVLRDAPKSFHDDVCFLFVLQRTQRSRRRLFWINLIVSPAERKYTEHALNQRLGWFGNVCPARFRNAPCKDRPESLRWLFSLHKRVFARDLETNDADYGAVFRVGSKPSKDIFGDAGYSFTEQFPIDYNSPVVACLSRGFLDMAGVLLRRMDAECDAAMSPAACFTCLSVVSLSNLPTITSSPVAAHWIADLHRRYEMQTGSKWTAHWPLISIFASMCRCSSAHLIRVWIDALDEQMTGVETVAEQDMERQRSALFHLIERCAFDDEPNTGDGIKALVVLILNRIGERGAHQWSNVEQRLVAASVNTFSPAAAVAFLTQAKFLPVGPMPSRVCAFVVYRLAYSSERFSKDELAFFVENICARSSSPFREPYPCLVQTTLAPSSYQRPRMDAFTWLRFFVRHGASAVFVASALALCVRNIDDDCLFFQLLDQAQTAFDSVNLLDMRFDAFALFPGRYSNQDFLFQTAQVWHVGSLLFSCAVDEGRAVRAEHLLSKCGVRLDIDTVRRLNTLALVFHPAHALVPALVQRVLNVGLDAVDICSCDRVRVKPFYNNGNVPDSPLFVACKIGSPQSVHLLLDAAGAAVQQASDTTLLAMRWLFQRRSSNADLANVLQRWLRSIKSDSWQRMPRERVASFVRDACQNYKHAEVAVLIDALPSQVLNAKVILESQILRLSMVQRDLSNARRLAAQLAATIDAIDFDTDDDALQNMTELFQLAETRHQQSILLAHTALRRIV